MTALETTGKQLASALRLLLGDTAVNQHDEVCLRTISTLGNQVSQSTNARPAPAKRPKEDI